MFINALPVNQFINSKVNLLNQLLYGFYKNHKSKINLLLLDRGFFTKEVIRTLSGKKIKFLMPAVKNKAIAKLIKQFEKGEISNNIGYIFGKTRVK